MIIIYFSGYYLKDKHVWVILLFIVLKKGLSETKS